MSALLHQYSVHLIPPVVRLIPTDFDIENSVRLNTAVSKKVSTLLQQSAKKCPPYSNILLVPLITVRLSTVPRLLLESGCYIKIHFLLGIFAALIRERHLLECGT